MHQVQVVLGSIESLVLLCLGIFWWGPWEMVLFTSKFCSLTSNFIHYIMIDIFIIRFTRIDLTQTLAHEVVCLIKE